MRPESSNQLLHNPFRNRFNEPVSHREAELQSEGYVTWLRERNLEHSGFKIPHVVHSKTVSHVRGVISGVFALLLVLVVSMIVLVKLF
jgi:hypothetical protein